MAEAAETIDVEAQDVLTPPKTRAVAKRGNGRNSVAITPVSATPMELLDRALSTGADADTLGKLMSLQERWEKNQGRKAFDAAMSDAKAEIPPIKKNRHVGFKGKNGGASTDYDHEDLAEIARTVDPILAQHGLSYRFRTAQAERITVTCIITHRDGHFEETTLSCGADTSGNKNSIQAIGSAVTYLQRYTLKAALGLAATKDDDGRASGGVAIGNGNGSTEGNGRISDQQVNNILDLITSGGANHARFCGHFKIADVQELPASEYEKAIAMLKKFADQKGGRQ